MVTILKKQLNMDFKKMVVILLGGCFFIGCERNFPININGDKKAETIRFDCGTITITSYCASRVFFNILLDFELSGLTYINPDSIVIEFNDEKIIHSFKDYENDFSNAPVKVTENNKYRISFHINDPVPRPGDTIYVKDLGFLYCNNKRVNMGEISLIIK